MGALMKFSLLFVLNLLLSVSINAQEFVSQKHKTPVLELFSSEGCSSCPPAERQFSLLKNHKGLWVDFVPINFHVDYWNRLGWTDPYSKELYTQRQHQYAQYWNRKNVYTPAFAFQSQDLGPVLKFSELDNIKKIKSSVEIKVHVTEKNNQYFLKISTAQLEKNKKYELFASIMSNDLVSEVTSGENSGRTLQQNFVALASQQKMLEQPKVELVFDKNKFMQKKKTSFVVWVTEVKNPEIIQSVGGYIDN